MLLLLLVVPVQASASGSTGTRLPERPELTPKERATMRYKTGIKHSDKAAQFEQQVQSVSDGKKQAALEKKVTREYAKSIRDFEKALNYFPRYFEVHSSLGNVLQKTGRLEESLAAYNESLKINPSYNTAIANRAEAFLQMDRLEDAKQDYLAIADSEPQMARHILNAMTHWVDAHRAKPGGQDTATIEEFSDWIIRHQAMATGIKRSGKQTAAEDRKE